MNSLMQKRWFVVVSLVVLIAGGCSTDDDPAETTDAGLQDAQEDDDAEEDVTEDADSESTDTPDAGDYEGEICPDDGSFDHYDPGSCILEGSDEQSAANCPASHQCLDPDHCVGQGGVGEPEECRTVNCGVIDCAPGCECVGDSICECPDE